MQIAVDRDVLLHELEVLAQFTDAEPAAEGTAVTRVVFTPDDLRARAWLKDLAEAEGFTVRADAVGNTFIRWAGTQQELPPVATG
jgi:ureidoglycolate amidohydrolase